ncbi:MAG: T9SS type A sorting domain-containing protein [Flavobacteriaceae bacterium]|nr:T9SS type A sorting domain-containing protein [Flavobacteriaceae bacterium]
MKTAILNLKILSYLFILSIIVVYSTSLHSQVRIIKVDPFTDEVTIHNYNPTSVDISGYWFCTKRTYAPLNTATIIDGSLNLDGGANIILIVNTSSGLDNVASDLSIYHTPSFGLATNMVDFMQYGNSFSGINGRENEAVSQGFWAASTFISGDPAPWSFNGDNTQYGVEYWSSTALGINDEFLNEVLSIYPNPVKDYLKIDKMVDVNLFQASIFDYRGRLVKLIDLSNNSNNYQISIKNLYHGLFILKLIDNDGRILTRKFIKE